MTTILLSVDAQKKPSTCQVQAHNMYLVQVFARRKYFVTSNLDLEKQKIAYACPRQEPYYHIDKTDTHLDIPVPLGIRPSEHGTVEVHGVRVRPAPVHCIHLVSLILKEGGHSTTDKTRQAGRQADCS